MQQALQQAPDFWRGCFTMTAARARRVLRRVLVHSLDLTRTRIARSMGRRQGWEGYAPRRDLPQMQLFHDIDVMPGQTTYNRGFLAVGGPRWPDFDRQTWVRFNRRGAPIDAEPQMPSRPPRAFQAPCLWGGFAFLHFGHLTAEVIGRVLVSVRQRPEDHMLFMALPGHGIWHYPDHFWQLMQWCGLQRDRVHIVTSPLRCRELRVMPEPEQLAFLPPSAAYLALLAENAARNDLVPRASERLYVTRAGMPKLGGGFHAGERYLVSILEKLNFSILYPEQEALQSQLARYAGAVTIVFSEGSAVHGRQLLGRLDQRIMVLNRRNKSRIAFSALTARCNDLSYCEAGKGSIAPVSASGVEMPAISLCFYDRNALMDGFARIGVALAPLWDEAAFQAAVRTDLIGWLAMVKARRQDIDLPATLHNARALVESLGLRDLSPIIGGGI